jgi:hypothetical protein
MATGTPIAQDAVVDCGTFPVASVTPLPEGNDPEKTQLLTMNLVASVFTLVPASMSPTLSAKMDELTIIPCETAYKTVPLFR